MKLLHAPLVFGSIIRNYISSQEKVRFAFDISASVSASVLHKRLLTNFHPDRVKNKKDETEYLANIIIHGSL